MSYKIVVARYNEDINWLQNEINNCIIYNKGLDLGINNQIFLPNVGRESETYLRYVIDNYFNLPDVVIFTQANISDHRGGNNVSYLIQLKNEALQNDTGKNNPSVFTPNENACWAEGNHWGPNWNYNRNNNTYYCQDSYKNNNRIKFIDWFKVNIQPNYPNPINIFTNAIFAVKKELILKHPREYYERLISEVNHHINPAEGHFFERSWFYIF
jgi:Protein of unknown function (DUF3431)